MRTLLGNMPFFCFHSQIDTQSLQQRVVLPCEDVSTWDFDVDEIDK